MKNKKKALAFVASSILVFPIAFASAQGKDLTTAASNIQKIIAMLTQAAYMLAFLAFFYGIATLLFSKSDELKKKGTQIMIWSIIAIFVMTSIWGIVKVLQGTLGAEDNQAVDVVVPTLKFNQ